MNLLDAILYPFGQLRKDVNQIMTTVSDIEKKIQTLNETIVAEAEQQAATVQSLRDAISNGADPSALNRIADELDASIERVKGIVPDESPSTETA